MTGQTEGRAPLAPVERMTPQEIDELAYDLVTGQVWISVFGAPSWASFQGFFTLMVGGLSAQGHPWDDVCAWGEQIGGAWEYISKASPVSVNGMPSFLSMHLIHFDDLSLIEDAWKAKDRALAATRPGGAP